MVVALIGLVTSILLILLGALVLGRRGELSTERSAKDGSDVQVDVESGVEESTAGVGVSVSAFHGIQRGLAFYGEKSTADILSMIAGGRLREAWPWAAMSLGVLMLFIFIPLLIGILVGLQETLLCLLVGLFFVGALFAAFPRRTKA
ncbi:MAG: hypothetical protein K6U78_13675 [Anaerolineae bacterium]|jgi:hypothetical protein|nr:hypothetical protein [Anaerolineae bacterium]